MTDAAFWRQPTAAVLETFGAAETGLSSREAAARLLKYGGNDAATAKRIPAWLRFAQRFANPLVLILLLASGLSAVTGDVASFVIISGIVAGAYGHSRLQEWVFGGFTRALLAQTARAVLFSH